jgi:hypothetical protein
MKKIIGYLECVCLPEWDISCIAKVDTGACSSTLHAKEIEVYRQSKEERIRFLVDFPSSNPPISQRCDSKLMGQKRITSSNGQISTRYVIETRLLISGEIATIEANLSDRTTMTYPMLVGREALAGRFLIDPELTSGATETAGLKP